MATSWMLITFFTWIVISTASCAPSPSASVSNRRSRRGEDEWIPAVLDNVCPWAECKGWIGCPERQGSRCGMAPRRFMERPAKGGMRLRRDKLGTCYGYSEKRRIPRDRCKDGPRVDECVCINFETLILRMGYGDDPIHSQTDALIGDICETQISPCLTAHAMTTTVEETAPLPVRTVRLTTDVTTSGLATTVTTPITVTTLITVTSVNPRPVTNAPSDGSSVTTPEQHDCINHFYIWPPVLAAFLSTLLLEALCRMSRKSNSAKITRAQVPLQADPGVNLDSDGYLAVTPRGHAVSPASPYEEMGDSDLITSPQRLQDETTGSDLDEEGYQTVTTRVQSGMISPLSDQSSATADARKTGDESPNFRLERPVRAPNADIVYAEPYEGLMHSPIVPPQHRGKLNGGDLDEDGYPVITERVPTARPATVKAQVKGGNQPIEAAGSVVNTYADYKPQAGKGVTANMELTTEEDRQLEGPFCDHNETTGDLDVDGYLVITERVPTARPATDKVQVKGGNQPNEAEGSVVNTYGGSKQAPVASESVHLTDGYADYKPQAGKGVTAYMELTTEDSQLENALYNHNETTYEQICVG